MIKLEHPHIPEDLTEYYELPDEDEFENCLFDEADMAHENMRA